MPKEKMEGVGWVAYVKDTEGNLFRMIEDTTDS